MSAARRIPWPAGYVLGALFFGLGASACGADSDYVLGRIIPESAGAEGSDGSVASLDAAPPDDASLRDDAVPDDATAERAECDPGQPRNDYRFDGTGTLLPDALGGGSGVLHGGASLDGSGELVLDGDDDYVDLPNDLLSGLVEVTIVVWVRHLGGPAYTRVIDLGSGSDGEDPAEGLGTVGSTYLAITPMTGFVPRFLAGLISQEGAGGEIAAVTDTRLDDGLHLVAVAVTSTSLELFHDGDLVSRVPKSVPLESIEAVNNWLGRSQYDQDPYFHGAYRRLAVFDRALEPCAIRAILSRGPTG